MMRALHKHLKAGSPSQLCHNAKVEAFHIHSRNLIELFKNDKQCAIDPRAFTVEDYQIEGDFIPRRLESKISQQIVHLTHERTDVEADKLSEKERDQTLIYINKQIERFEKALQPDWQPVWREGVRAMNFDESEVRALNPKGGTAAPYLEISGNYVRGATAAIQTVSSEPTKTGPTGPPERQDRDSDKSGRA
jgi:hypothetical protein